MAVHRARRQARQRAAAARAVAPQRTQEAINRMASEMGIPPEEAAPNPVLPANVQQTNTSHTSRRTTDTTSRNSRIPAKW